MPRMTRAEAETLVASTPIASSRLSAAETEALLQILSGERADGSSAPIVSQTAAGGLAPLGYEQVPVAAAGGAAAALTVPAGAVLALAVPSVAVRWRDDGTDPTAAVGLAVAAGQEIFYDADLAAFRVIAQDAAAGVLDVAYYGV